MTELNSKAFEILSGLDSKFYVDMTEPLRCGVANTLYIKGNSILIDNNGVLMWTSDNRSQAKEIIECIAENRRPGCSVEAHDNIMLDECAKAINAVWRQVPANVAAKFSADKYIIETDAKIRALSHEDADFVWHNYGFFKDKADGRERALKAIDIGMFGVEVEGNLAGFVGVHDEGAIGLLYVVPQYTGRGFGKALEMFMANDFIEKNKIPFCHILETNDVSINLHKKMGMWISENKKVYWMG